MPKVFWVIVYFIIHHNLLRSSPPICRIVIIEPHCKLAAIKKEWEKTKREAKHEKVTLNFRKAVSQENTIDIGEERKHVNIF